MQTLPRTSPTTTTGQSPGLGIALFTLLLALPLAASADVAATPSPGAVTPHEVSSPAGVRVAPAPGEFHGNWRVVARDDRHDQALMQVSIRHDRGARTGDGDYALFQPFCDVLAHAPITGASDCEATGASDVFERVQLRRRWLVLVFRPTADGQAHTLAVRRAGERLVGEYRNPDGARAVLLQPVE